MAHVVAASHSAFDYAEHFTRDHDARLLQSTTNDVTAQSNYEDSNTRVGTKSKEDHVSSTTSTGPPSSSNHQGIEVASNQPSIQRSSSYAFPPQRGLAEKSSWIESKGSSGARVVGEPESFDHLQRVVSAPLTSAQSPEGHSSARPKPMRQGTSMLQKLRPTKSRGESAFFDPNLYHDYEESSGDDSDASNETPTISRRNTLSRTPTTSKQVSNSRYKRFAFGNQDYKTRGHVSKKDGRLNISLLETSKGGYLAKVLKASLEHHLGSSQQQEDDLENESGHAKGRATARPRPTRHTTASTISNLSKDDPDPFPKLNIVIMIIGSRGDIQPFLHLGKVLKEKHGHRVRIATHPIFKDFVEEDAKLEFFSVGGDPAELMAFMVKNPGLVPKTETITSGEIPRRRAQMFEMFQGFWKACISSGDGVSGSSNARSEPGKNLAPFVADAIIANPPSFAHIHCAERLGIPLHLMFTFPNTPTQQFPHPLTNIRQANVDANYTNFMSYPLVEMMQWQGLGDLINDFRVNTLGLDPMSMLWAPGQIYRLKVPYSYLWSPGLVPKPSDWSDEIDITGFVFLDLASSFKPPAELTKFLEAGEPPVYIGFGSIVVDDPDKSTDLIFEAVQKAGVRALVSKGWGGFGGEKECPENVYLLDNTPHDWLFPRVSAVVHHGGAGTTAIGLKCGKPTMIVPFFGDQPFWGAMVAKANAGVEPVPYKQLSVDKLAKGIKLLLTDEVQDGAKALAQKIEAEGDGALNAVKSFHKHLPTTGYPNVRCSILKDRVAVWHLRKSELRLSGLAAQILVMKRKITWDDLRLVRIYEWADFESPGEPITGVGSSLFASLMGVGAGVGTMPFHWAKIIKQRDVYEQERKQTLNGEQRSRSKTKAQNQSEAKAYTSGANSSPHQTRQQKEGDAGKEELLPTSNVPDGLTQTINHTFEVKDADQGPPKSDEVNYRLSRKEIAKQLLNETGKGFRNSATSLIKLPINLSLALARGFHNAPKLYGDETVRTIPRITGFHSGCHAAASSFMFGIYDGVTGFFTQPYYGAKYDGATGFLKGIGKGTGGLVLKDLSAVFGVPAYIAQGTHREIVKHRQPTALIRRSRVEAGAREYSSLSESERDELSQLVAKDWAVIEEVSAEIERVIKKKGMRGRVEVWKNRRWLKEAGIVGNIRGIQRALDAYREGRDWEEEFREEKVRRRREKERQRQSKNDAIKKKYERLNTGKRLRGPDLHMKTRFGTYRALKKGAKKTEKSRENSGAATLANTNDALQLSTEDAGGLSRNDTSVANEETGTIAVDQAVASTSSRRISYQTANKEIPTRRHLSDLSTDNTVVSDGADSPGTLKSTSNRRDSRDTLCQSHVQNQGRSSPSKINGACAPLKEVPGITDMTLDTAINSEHTNRNALPQLAA